MRKPDMPRWLLQALLAASLLASGLSSHGPALAQTPLDGLPNKLLELPPFSFIAPRDRHRGRPSRPSRPARSAQFPDRMPGEVIAAGLTDPNIETLEKEGYKVIERRFLGSTLRPLARLRMPRGTGLEDARRRIAQLSADVIVDSNHFYRLQEGRCEGRNCLSLGIVKWPQGRGSRCSSLPLIGMIDTAVNIHHPALKGQKVEFMKLDRTRPLSDFAHGTAIAAQLVAGAKSRVPGLLPGAHLIAIDAFQNVRGLGPRMQALDLASALDLLLVRQVAIVNLSFAGPDNRLLAELVQAALRRDVLLVAAVGTGGPRGAPVYPAAYEGVVAVTALNRKMQVLGRAGRGSHVDFAAPGAGLWTAAAVSGWRRSSGTSFSTPFVTAALALAMARDPELRGPARVESLSKAARDLGDPGRDPVFGWGLVQAAGDCDPAR